LMEAAAPAAVLFGRIGRPGADYLPAAGTMQSGEHRDDQR
jgi:hypothetical protein